MQFQFLPLYLYHTTFFFFFKNFGNSSKYNFSDKILDVIVF